MDQRLAAKLQRQHYHIVGEHGGVKVCHWTKESLLRDRVCYKEKFYGISAHRCLQMAPSVDRCNNGCIYCWREPHLDTTGTLDDDPLHMLYESIRGQRRLISGHGGDERVTREKWEEAQTPKHVAISLNGEPTMYAHLDEFIGNCHDHGLATFLVTNGTLPKVLERLDNLPTQLYVSVDAPNEEIYNRICKPHSAGAWDSLMETLELLPSLDTRTVSRHTILAGENLGYVDEYAKLDNMADPTFIEAKGYVFVGHSRKVLTIDNMPSHDSILEFSSELANATGRKLLADVRPSRVALIGHEMSHITWPKKVRDFPVDLGKAPPIKHLPLIDDEG